MPIRKIPISGRSVTGRVASYSGGAPVAHESNLEHDAILLFQFDPDVVGLEEQPLRIAYEKQDRRGNYREHHYIPDLLVRYRRESARPSLLVEVKYHQQLRFDADVLLPKIRAGQRYARERGWRFRVCTERHIRGCRPFLLNVKFLLPYRRFKRADPASDHLVSKVTEEGSITPQDLLRACGVHDTPERGKYIASLWRLLATFEITADLTQTLAMSTPLRAPS